MRTLVLLAAFPLAVSAQSVGSFSEPVTESDAPPRVCVDLESTQVCRTVDDDGEGVIEVEGAGFGGALWRASAPGIVDDVRAFRVVWGDGRSALAVAVLEGVSNGLGVATWSVHVVPEGADQPAYGFIARDFDPEGGSFATWGGEPVVWATEWMEAEDPAGRRGTGMYLVGRPFFIGADGLAPAADLPIRARRLLAEFRTEPGGPVGWLSSRAAETRRQDPARSGAPGGDAGRITSVRPGPDGFRVTWTDGATERAFVVDPWSPPADAEAARLGDRATGRLYPLAYRPADLDGRAATLGMGAGGTVTLWLD
ncbi:hypothetical protein [Rubrivirga marina]|nr:hypothetical protein [Rubrivirga marina]